jgi:hypothetical protein
MYGVCRITDQGILHFNVSSKNYSSKVYTCLEKVVVLVTQSTTKLSLHFLDFSTILYWIYKLLLKHSKGVRSILRVGPWDFSNHTTLPPNFITQSLQKFKGRTGPPGGAGEFAAGEGDRRSWPTSGPIRWASSPRGYWWWIWGRGRLRRGGTTETGGGDRREDCSGELLAGEYARAAREASRCPRRGARRVGYHRERAEEGARGGG